MPRYIGKFSLATHTAAIHIATCPRGGVERGYTVLLFDADDADAASEHYAQWEDFATRGMKAPADLPLRTRHLRTRDRPAQ